MDTNICNVELCTSCGACVSSCPQQCISFKTNEYGFHYPFIDSDKCIECGKCKDVCHAVADVAKNYPLNAYAVWSNDAEDRKTSTSGGAASVFYKKILNKGGFCFGAVYDEEFNVVIKGYCDNRIKEFKQSKYVHSDMNNCYSEIKKLVNNGSEVIFIGLPCQVAALKQYLKKEYGNLMLVDLICHGTPPQTYLNEHVRYINEIIQSKVENITFRFDNEFYFVASNKNTVLYKAHKSVDTYLLSFLEALTYYESCYNCKYACKKRCSDITIGDFWGLGKETPFNHPYTGSISLVLTNTDKGQAFFDSIKDCLFCEERTVEEAIKGNAQLNMPSKRNSNRDLFLDSFIKDGFEAATLNVYKKTIKSNQKALLINNAKRKLRSVAKRIIRR